MWRDRNQCHCRSHKLSRQGFLWVATTVTAPKSMHLSRWRRGPRCLPLLQKICSRVSEEES